MWLKIFSAMQQTKWKLIIPPMQIWEDESVEVFLIWFGATHSQKIDSKQLEQDTREDLSRVSRPSSPWTIHSNQPSQIWVESMIYQLLGNEFFRRMFTSDLQGSSEK